MTKSKIKKFSVLGITLLATSAVVAGFYPSKKPLVGNGMRQVGVGTADTATCVTISGSNGNCFASQSAKPGQGNSSSGGAGSTTGPVAGDGNTTTVDPS